MTAGQHSDRRHLGDCDRLPAVHHHSHFSPSLNSPHYTTHLSPRTSLHLLSSICIHSIHILPVSLFCFPPALPWAFLAPVDGILIIERFPYFISLPISFSVSVNGCVFFSLPLHIPSFFFLVFSPFSLCFVSWC